MTPARRDAETALLLADLAVEDAGRDLARLRALWQAGELRDEEALLRAVMRQRGATEAKRVALARWRTLA